MLVIPVLIVVALFLGWFLIKLTLNALALFVAVTVGIFVHGLAAGTANTLLAGMAAGMAVVAIGRNADVVFRSPALRLIVAFAFAIPAGAAAYHAMLGISGFLTSGGWGTAMSMVAAVLIAVTAGQRVTAGSDRS
ncbi:MAG: hypothetical protein ABIO86_04105 [Sphingomonas sp.]